MANTKEEFRFRNRTMWPDPIGVITLAASGTGTGTGTRTNIIPLPLAVSGTRTGRLKAIEISLKHTTWNSFKTHYSLSLCEVQCERFYIKPYNPFVNVLVPFPISVLETASVNKPQARPSSLSHLLRKMWYFVALCSPPCHKIFTD